MPHTEGAQEFDYVIVGSGSAGAALAYRLSEGGKFSIAVIEYGGTDIGPLIQMPAALSYPMNMPLYDWEYVSEPNAHLGGRRLACPRGKVIGGSSSINGMVYVRGHARDYDTWAELGAKGWSYADVLPYFRRMETSHGGEADWRGNAGPLHVSRGRRKNPLYHAFEQAAEQAGYGLTDDYNGHRQEGFGPMEMTVHRGRRWSVANAYLRPACKRSNVQMFRRTMAKRILFDGKRAVGVACSQGARQLNIAARREVILSAGSINSPKLLMQSGIGPAAELAGHGIEIVHDLPGVGKNLQDHLQIRTIYKVNKPITLNDEVNNPIRKMMMGIEYALFRTGPLTMAASQVCIFTKTDQSMTRPDIQYHLQPLSADKPADGTHRFSAFTASVCQLRPTSTGHIALKSSNPTDYPAIHPNYLATEEDQKTAIESIKVTRRIVGAPALAPLIKEEHEPGVQHQTDAELLEYARNRATTIYHPTGTCKMGQDAMAVVDERLRVHGIEGVRVVDASIMPIIVSGNTNAPTIMIAEKASDMIKEDAQVTHESTAVAS